MGVCFACCFSYAPVHKSNTVFRTPSKCMEKWPVLRGGRVYESADMGNRHGFTLMELMVVIALFSILTAVAAPSIVSWKRGHDTSGVLREMLTTLRLVRIAAIEANEVAAVIVDADADTLEAFVDDGGTDTTDSDADGVPDSLNNGQLDTGERVIAELLIPDNIGIDGSGLTILRFNGRGFSVDADGKTMGAMTTVQVTGSFGGSHSVSVLPTGHSVIN